MYLSQNWYNLLIYNYLCQHLLFKAPTAYSHIVNFDQKCTPSVAQKLPHNKIKRIHRCNIYFGMKEGYVFVYSIWWSAWQQLRQCHNHIAIGGERQSIIYCSLKFVYYKNYALSECLSNCRVLNVLCVILLGKMHATENWIKWGIADVELQITRMMYLHLEWWLKIAVTSLSVTLCTHSL